MKKEWVEPEIETLELGETELLNLNIGLFSPALALLAGRST